MHTSTSRTVVETPTPECHASQLVSHLGPGPEWTPAWTPEGSASAATTGGATARVVAGDGARELLASGDARSVSRAAAVLGEHLERFGRRSELRDRS
jgi:hypothetical protein